MWYKVRAEQDEQSADQFRNARLLQRFFDVWKLGYGWAMVSLLRGLWALFTQPY
jgi:hypothetical protein